ncbi:MAG: hypothetical protein RR549_05815, partial [Oscillospiraceae bacterium]
MNNLTNITSFNMFADFSDKIYDNFIKDDRWQYLTKGLGTTLLITLFAIIIGIILGFIIATIRSSTDKLSESSQA